MLGCLGKSADFPQTAGINHFLVLAQAEPLVVEEVEPDLVAEEAELDLLEMGIGVLLVYPHLLLLLVHDVLVGWQGPGCQLPWPAFGSREIA